MSHFFCNKDVAQISDTQVKICFFVIFLVYQKSFAECCLNIFVGSPNLFKAGMKMRKQISKVGENSDRKLQIVGFSGITPTDVKPQYVTKRLGARGKFLDKDR